MIQVETFLKYEKSIRNLNTQEARLQRKLVKDTLELQRLQAERHQQEAEKEAFLARHAAKTPPLQPNSLPIGFEFSSPSGTTQTTSEAAPDPAIFMEQAA